MARRRKTRLVPEKSWFESKTIWLNIISFVVTLVAAPEIQKILPPNSLQYIAALVFALNLALRFVTFGPITPTPVESDNPVAD